MRSKEWARLFHDDLADGGVWPANLGHGQQLQLMRTLPHEETIAPDEHVEALP